MRDEIRRWFYGLTKSNDPNKYISVDEHEINDEIKNEVIQLEDLAGKLAEKLQSHYEMQFEEQKKRNFSIWVSRDLDGDEIGSLTADCCLEKEYRSQLAINYNDPAEDNDFYEATITLWHYQRGFLKSFAFLYDATRNNLEKDIEDTLTNLLE